MRAPYNAPKSTCFAAGKHIHEGGFPSTRDADQSGEDARPESPADFVQQLQAAALVLLIRLHPLVQGHNTFKICADRQIRFRAWTYYGVGENFKRHVPQCELNNECNDADEGGLSEVFANAVADAQRGVERMRGRQHARKAGRPSDNRSRHTALGSVILAESVEDMSTLTYGSAPPMHVGHMRSLRWRATCPHGNALKNPRYRVYARYIAGCARHALQGMRGICRRVCRDTSQGVHTEDGPTLGSGTK